jgi:hypothetical protein
MSNNVTQELQQSAFGSLVVSEPTPIVQLNFNYNVNEELVVLSNNNGTSTIVDNMLNLSTGAAANQSAVLNSKSSIKYNSGQGVHFRASGVFTTGVVGSDQWVGAGDSGDALLFGYQGATFGIMRRSGGLPEVRTLEVTTKSTTAENITITLDGDADATVAVTDATATDLTTTANEIAAHDYSTLGRGWDAHAEGERVTFISYDSSSRTGTYSLAGTTAVGTFTQDVPGVAPTDDFTPQLETSPGAGDGWNMDSANNTGILPKLDWTKGNVFQIQYQWLGFGVLNFLVENPENGEDTLVHQVLYPNAYTIPSLANPNLQLCASVENTTNTTDITLNVGSIGGFIEGRRVGTHFHNGVSNLATLSAGTERPILSIHNKRVYSGKLNKVRIKLIFTSLASDGAKSVIARYLKNAIITGASFSDVEADVSVIEFDSSATIVSGGDEQFTTGLAKVDSQPIDMSTMSYHLDPGDTFTITGESSAANDVLASLTWEELF